MSSRRSGVMASILDSQGDDQGSIPIRDRLICQMQGPPPNHGAKLRMVEALITSLELRNAARKFEY